MASYTSSDQELIRRLRQKRPDWENEKALHTFWVASYTGDGGFRNGQVPAPAAPFWGRQSYDATLWSLSGVFPVPPYLAGPARQTWSYIVPFRDEDQLSYEDRVNSTVYSNYIEPIVDLTNAFLTATDAVRENLPRPISAWNNNVDGEGRSIQWLAQLTLKQVQLVGYIFTLVDLPQDTGKSLADSLRNGVQPVATNIWPQDVYDYDLNPDGTIKSIKIASYIQGERKSILEDRTIVEQITIWTKDTWERYEISKDRNADRISKHEKGPNELGVVPICVARWRSPVSSTGSIKGHPQISTLAQLARDLYNRESEHVFNMRQSTFAQLIAPGDPNGDDTMTGPGNTLTEDAQTKGITRYISPDASIAASYEKRIDRVENSIFRTAGIDRNDQNRPETAESKRMRFVQTNAILAAAACNIDQWEKDLYVLVARAYRLDPDKVLERIAIHRKKDYAAEDLVHLLDAAIKAKELPTGPTAMARLTQRVINILVPDQSEKEREQVNEEITIAADKLFAPEEIVPKQPELDVPNKDPGLNTLSRPLDINPLRNSLARQGK